MDIYFEAQEDNIRYWTRLAKDCYNINCICSRCSFVPERYKDVCQVKNYVLALYRKFGEPPENTEYASIIRNLKEETQKSYYSLSLDIGISATALRRYVEGLPTHEETRKKIEDYLEAQCLM